MKVQLTTAVWATSMALVFTACQKETNQLSQNEATPSALTSIKSPEDGAKKSNSSHVYTLSNATNGNMVLDYISSSNGTLTYSASYSTGGNGSGGGLGNQGAVILVNDNEFLLAVNAGSNSVSSFKINNNGLHLKSTVSSGGVQPVSITQYGDLVFVLNAGVLIIFQALDLNKAGCCSRYLILQGH